MCIRDSLKPLAFAGDAGKLPAQLGLPVDEGVIDGKSAKEVFGKLQKALLQHRIWGREAHAGKIPA